MAGLLVDDLGQEWLGGLTQLGHARSCAPSVQQAGRCYTKAHVRSVCFNCFRYFRGRLQVFRCMLQKYIMMLHMLQWLYTHIASICSKCFIYFSDVCYKSFYLDVAYVLDICCKCLIWLLYVLAMAFKCFQAFCMSFRYMLQVFSCFRRMLRLFYLNVAKVDLVLHMLQ
jgi:hypothetical protein